MKENIESTIKEIIRSVIQFDAEKNTPDGLTKFTIEFERLLKLYSRLMKRSKYVEVEHFLNFKDEISDVFDFLFTDSNIFKIAESSINQNEGITGTILAIGRNVNPLNSIPDNRIGTLKKSIDNNPYLEFISIYKDSKDSTPQQKKEDRTKEEPNKLVDVFESVSKYNFIMELFVKKSFCEPGTYIWKDETGGSKGLLVAILKNLHSKGYYKENKKLSNDQINKIALNTFGAGIKSSTIGHITADSFDLSYIPIASTIEIKPT